VTDCYRHAFPQELSGQINLSLGGGPVALIVTVADDGIGISPVSREPRGFGQPIIAMLARQANAEVAFAPGPGTTVTVTLAAE
jgi:two-component sensor histidine kinase